jgi:excisionase family DNA binding protein
VTATVKADVPGQPGTQPRRRLYSINAAMHELSIGRTSIYDLIAAEKLKTVKVGRRRLITAEALDEFVAGLSA